MSLKGSCLCGAVSYEVTGTFRVMGNCHCSICRKSHGAAFATWGIIDPEQFRWLAGEALTRSYEASPDRGRIFCQQCGSPLASAHDGKVGEIAVGTVDDDPVSRPVEHIFVGSKACWFEISDALPQFERWPPETGQ